MRVAFFGSGAFGLPTLAALHERHELASIVTQPDKPSGRNLRLAPTPIGEWAALHAPAVPLLKPASVNEPATRDALRALGADAWVVIAFGQKLGRALLDGVFAVNLHASLLPRWRGAAPINHAVIGGDAETGNSVITLADRMDAGLVLAESRRPIGPDQTAGELHDLLADDGPALVLDVLERRRAGSLAPAAQDEQRVTLAPKLSRDDAWVDFADSAFRCARRINGLSPWPGVTVSFRGEPLKLLRAEPASGAGQQSGVPGTIVDPERALVACAAHEALRLIEVQPPGKRAMPWPDFARGQRIQPGESLTGRSPC